MKVREITIKDIKQNMHMNLKKMAGIFIVFVVIGLIAGAVNAKLYDPERAVNITPLEEKIELTEKSSGFYYKDAFEQIKAKNDYLNAYLQYLSNVNLSQDSKMKLAEVQKELDAIQEPIDEAVEFYNKTALVVNGDRKFAVDKVYGIELEEIDEEIQYQEKVLEEVVSGKYTADYKQTKQDSISKSLTELKEERDLTEQKIIQIQSSSSIVLQANYNAANQIIEGNVTSINNVTDYFNSVMQEIAAAENYEIIYNKHLLEHYEDKAGINGELREEDILKNKVNEAIIYAKSIEGLDVPKERFFAFLMFFSALGLIVSGLFGAVYKREM